jgi:hypothetical protein
VNTIAPSPKPWLDASRTWVERPAKLFEAGTYPDRALTITQEHVAKLAERFSDPVPILIEHSDSPLQLGFLTEMRAHGPELFGTVTLTKEADELVRQSGATALSVGLSADLSEILEVSLVRNPRVPSAQLFFGVLTDLPDSNADRAELLQLRAEKQRERSREKVEHWIREGKISPAQAPAATCLLQATQNVLFDAESIPVSRLVEQLIELQPRQNWTQSITPQPVHQDYSAQLLMPEEAEFYRKNFPDIDLNQIAMRKTR